MLHLLYPYDCCESVFQIDGKKLLAEYPEKLQNLSYRLTAFVCKRPSVPRILSVRLVFDLYDLSRGLRS